MEMNDKKKKIQNDYRNKLSKKRTEIYDYREASLIIIVVIITFILLIKFF